MIEWAGGEMAIDTRGMQRMASPEIVAQANPDVILVTDYGFDHARKLCRSDKGTAGRRQL